MKLEIELTPDTIHLTQESFSLVKITAYADAGADLEELVRGLVKPIALQWEKARRSHE